jgi:hypothetical protein
MRVRPTAVEMDKNVKSRIVFETPEATSRLGAARNKSLTSYKLDSSPLHQTK